MKNGKNREIAIARTSEAIFSPPGAWTHSAANTSASHRDRCLAACARISSLARSRACVPVSVRAELCTDLCRRLSRKELTWQLTAGHSSTATIDGRRCDHTARTAPSGVRIAREGATPRACVSHLVYGSIPALIVLRRSSVLTSVRAD